MPLVLFALGIAPRTLRCQAPAYEADAKFQAAVKQAEELTRHDQYGMAADGWKKANKLAGGECRRCLAKAYAAEMKVGDFKAAAGFATQQEALPGTAAEKSVAETELGRAVLGQGGQKPKPAQLDAAHAAFQAALTDYPKNNAALFSDGCVLARMGKMDDAKKEFATCAEAVPASDPARVRAEHFAENPALSLNQMAPPVVVKAADGTMFNLDSMGGRVVLIDFWATWCGPCNEELPHLQKLVKEFQGEPLTVISISWDRDETAWKEFIAKHEMTWTQYRDADHRISDQFGVPSIPHYFLVDSDGVLYPQMLGADDGVEGKIKKLLVRAKQEGAGKEVATGGN